MSSGADKCKDGDAAKTAGQLIHEPVELDLAPLKESLKICNTMEKEGTQTIGIQPNYKCNKYYKHMITEDTTYTAQ